MSNTFIEFFSNEALENIMVLLKYKPDNLIFIGQKHNMVTRKINNTKQFAKNVSPDTKLRFIEVSRDNIDEIIRVIEELCDEFPDCQFELTGGAELVLIAYGIVSAKRKLNSLRIDPYTNIEIVNNDRANAKLNPDLSTSVEDNIILHGGVMTQYSGRNEWKFTPEFLANVREIWDIAKLDIPGWIKACNEIAEAIKKCPHDSSYMYRIPRRLLTSSSELLLMLEGIHMIKDMTVSQTHLAFRFKNKWIQQIVSKVGNILELHVYEVVTRKGSIFTSAEIGAIIDWDGKMASHSYDSSYDTTNEIDVIAMRNVVPTFISCKIGKADSLALHELETITTRFGGGYARKALVMAQSVNGSSGGQSFFKQRAKDMQIWVIDNVASMSDEELMRRLKISQDLS